jgi:hypothetical protein
MAGMDVVLDPAWTIHWTIAFPGRYQQVRSDFSVGTRLTQADTETPSAVYQSRRF